MIIAVGGNLLYFTRAYIDARRRLRKSLSESALGLDGCRFGQELQLVEELLGLARLLVVANNCNQDGTLLAIDLNHDALLFLISFLF